jgi:acetyl-CoA carboxylase carboxyl transferase subunit alpha
MKITAQDLLQYGIVDRIIDEPPGGAHSDPEAMIQMLGDVLIEELKGLKEMSSDALLAQRAERFYRIGTTGMV